MSIFFFFFNAAISANRRANLQQIEKLRFWFLNSFAGNRKVQKGHLRFGLSFTKRNMAAKWIYLSTKESPPVNGQCTTNHRIAVYWKVKVLTFVIAPLTWVRPVTSGALQSRKWQLIGMSQWCRSALCGHPSLTDNWTHDAASRHTIAPISHTRLSPRSPQKVSYYSFSLRLRVGGWVGVSTQ